MPRRTLIIGGGMAGMAAAVAAAEKGDSVTVLERNLRPLKKLGVSGNGRGNLLNSGPPCYYGDVAFAHGLLEKLPYKELAAFWNRLGVPLRQEEEGRVYPASLLASVAVDALGLRAEQLRVQVATLTRAVGLEAGDQGFTVLARESVVAASAKGKKPRETGTVDRKFWADRVIVAVGGAAAPAQGTDGSAYGLLTDFGHALAPPRPALCALVTEKKPLAGLEGQRAKTVLTLKGPKGEILHRTQGEILFAEDGVSGIAAMQMARFVAGGCRLAIDLRPHLNMADLPEAELSAHLKGLAEARLSQPISRWCAGLLPPPLSRALMKAAGILDLDRPVAALSQRDYAGLARVLADFSLAVDGVRGFESAQVTAGGVPPGEFYPETLESRLQKGLYAVGEVLDVDGDCGGFNLMFALASGLLAGRA